MKKTFYQRKLNKKMQNFKKIEILHSAKLNVSVQFHSSSFFHASIDRVNKYVCRFILDSVQCFWFWFISSRLLKYIVSEGEMLLIVWVNISILLIQKILNFFCSRFILYFKIFNLKRATPSMGKNFLLYYFK